MNRPTKWPAVAFALVLAACSASTALAADPPAHSRLLLGVTVNEGLGIFDSGLGAIYTTLIPAPSARVTYFLTERLELNGGASYQHVPFKVGGPMCGDSWNDLYSFSFVDLASRYNFAWGKAGFWFLAGGLLGGVVLHDYHETHYSPETVNGRDPQQHIKLSGERGSPAFGGKVQTGGGSWITPQVRWNLGLEYYMGMTWWQFLGDTKTGPFGQLSLMLGFDFGID